MASKKRKRTLDNNPQLKGRMTPICLRSIKPAAEDDKTTLVDGTVNAHAATKPG
jgi:hypothetical protein